MSEKKYIRFINSDYETLFHIPDGGRIRITYPDREPAERVCRFIDEYHTAVGNCHYHICEFAERMEQIGAKYEPLTTSGNLSFTPSIILRQVKMAPALPTISSTQGRNTVLRSHPREPRGARSIAFSDGGWMKAAIIALAALSNGATI